LAPGEQDPGGFGIAYRASEALASLSPSTEKFGIWWIGRGLIVLVIIVTAIGFTLGGKGSLAGLWVLFWFSAAGTLVEFFRSRM